MSNPVEKHSSKIEARLAVGTLGGILDVGIDPDADSGGEGDSGSDYVIGPNCLSLVDDHRVVVGHIDELPHRRMRRCGKGVLTSVVGAVVDVVPGVCLAAVVDALHGLFVTAPYWRRAKTWIAVDVADARWCRRDRQRTANVVENDR